MTSNDQKTFFGPKYEISTSLYEPIDAIDPEKAGCTPSPCNVKRITLESLQSYDFPDCSMEELSAIQANDMYMGDRRDACMLYMDTDFSGKGVRNVSLNFDLMTEYVKQMYKLRQSYLEKCEYASDIWVQTSENNDKSNICDNNTCFSL